MAASGHPKLQDAGLLHELYVQQEMTTIEVAKHVGASQSSVCLALKRHGIAARERGSVGRRVAEFRPTKPTVAPACRCERSVPMDDGDCLLCGRKSRFAA